MQAGFIALSALSHVALFSVVKRLHFVPWFQNLILLVKSLMLLTCVIPVYVSKLSFGSNSAVLRPFCLSRSLLQIYVLLAKRFIHRNKSFSETTASFTGSDFS